MYGYRLKLALQLGRGGKVVFAVHRSTWDSVEMLIASCPGVRMDCSLSSQWTHLRTEEANHLDSQSLALPETGIS